MNDYLEKWKVQFKKGYLELCILVLISRRPNVYGLEIISVFKKSNLIIKEGTLYPLLSRMTREGILKACWLTENNKGHPRKVYSMTSLGENILQEMMSVFEEHFDILSTLGIAENKKGD